MAKSQHPHMQKKQHAAPGQWDVFPPCRGGHTTIYGGYVWEQCPGHPLANHWGFVAQHRLVGESMLGRPLHKGEVVHHKDRVRTNNTPGNLEVMSQAEHRRHHARCDSNRIPITEQEARKALQETGGIKPAARALKVSHSTLRDRFPALCEPYRRATPTVIDNPRDIAEVLRMAADPSIGLREVALALRMSARTVMRICERRGVPWVKQIRSDTGRPRTNRKA